MGSKDTRQGLSLKHLEERDLTASYISNGNINKPSSQIVESKDVDNGASEADGFDDAFEDDDKDVDGGYGWVIIIASFFNAFIIDGIGSCFGLIFPYVVKKYGVTAFVASWAGSCYVALLVMGVVAAVLTRRFGARIVCVCGGLLACAAFATSAYSNNIVWFIITYGLVAGCSCGLVFLPSILIVNDYFRRKRGIANGIISSGSGVGLLVLGPIVNFLLDKYGLEGTVLTLAGILLNMCVFSSLYRPREKRATKRKNIINDDSKQIVSNKNTVQTQEFNHVRSDGKVDSYENPCTGVSHPLIPVQNENPIESERNANGDKISCRNCVVQKDATFSQENSMQAAKCAGNDLKLGKQSGRNLPSFMPNVVHNGSQGAYWSSATQLHCCSKNIPKRDRKHHSLHNIPSSLKHHHSGREHTRKDLHHLHPGAHFPYRGSELYLAGSVDTVIGVHNRHFQGNHDTAVAKSAFQASPFTSRCQIENHEAKHAPLIQRFFNNLKRGSVIRDSQSTLGSQDKISLTEFSVVPIKEHTDTDQYTIPPITVQDFGSAHSVNSQSHRVTADPTYSIINQSHPVNADYVHSAREQSHHASVEKVCDEVSQGDFMNAGDVTTLGYTTKELLRSPAFHVFCLGAALIQLGYPIAGAFLADFAYQFGLGSSHTAILMMLLGFSNIVGRLIGGALASWRFDPLKLNNLSLLLGGVTCLLSPLYTEFWALCLLAALFGFFLGFFPPLQPLVIVEYFGLGSLSSAFGVLTTLKGVATLLGPPLAGWVYDNSSDYAICFVVAGVALVTSAIAHSFIPPLANHRWTC